MKAICDVCKKHRPDNLRVCSHYDLKKLHEISKFDKEFGVSSQFSTLEKYSKFISMKPYFSDKTLETEKIQISSFASRIKISKPLNCYFFIHRVKRPVPSLPTPTTAHSAFSSVQPITSPI